jgi:hypothetical protein
VTDLLRWERLEAWIFETHPDGGRFTNYDVADGLGLTNRQGTYYLQAYQEAQRRLDSTTLYVIHRDGRTKRAVWTAGVRTADARALSHQFFDDVEHRFKRAIAPDLAHIADRNPRARPKCNQITASVGHHALELLRIAVDGLDDGDDPA